MPCIFDEAKVEADEGYPREGSSQDEHDFGNQSNDGSRLEHGEFDVPYMAVPLEAYVCEYDYDTQCKAENLKCHASVLMCASKIHHRMQKYP